MRGLGKSIAYGMFSGAATGGISDVLNGGNGSGALWGAVSGGALAGIGWGLQREALDQQLHNVKTATASASGEPIPKYVPNSRPMPYYKGAGVIAPRLPAPPSSINWGALLGQAGRLVSRSVGWVLSLATLVEGDVPRRIKPQYPIYHVYEELTPHIYQNTVAAQASGHPNILTYGGSGSGSLRRPQALLGYPKPPTGYSLDEYPYASTLEGGAGSRVMAVPIREQFRQGGQLNAFYSTNRMTAGQKFLVVPVPR